MADTKIEWTEKTWNPIRARDMRTNKVGHYCELTSSGCANCYASAMQVRFGMPAFSWRSKDKVEVDGSVLVGELRIHLDEEVLAQPLKWKKPRRVFPCSMTDLFGAWVPDRWFVSVQVEEQIAVAENQDSAIGLDLGLKSFVVGSDGSSLEFVR